jgi:hypothetical protein
MMADAEAKLRSGALACHDEVHFLDTNAYALLLCGVPSDASGRLGARLLRKGHCEAMICEMTALEIHSVLGRLTRGRTGGLHPCDRSIESEGGYVQCPQRWTQPEKKGLRPLELDRLRKAIRDAEAGHGPIRLTVVDVCSADCGVGRGYLYTYAGTRRFGSHDAVIAAVATRKGGGKCRLVTSDHGLKALLKAIGQRYYDPVRDELWNPCAS